VLGTENLGVRVIVENAELFARGHEHGKLGIEQKPDYRAQRLWHVSEAACRATFLPGSGSLSVAKRIALHSRAAGECLARRFLIGARGGLAIAQCKAGIVGSLPAHSVRPARRLD
jgi:hypothetical protein